VAGTTAVAGLLQLKDIVVEIAHRAQKVKNITLPQPGKPETSPGASCASGPHSWLSRPQCESPAIRNLQGFRRIGVTGTLSNPQVRVELTG
jgi:hypothetical protein